jgi:hypothetical protein
MSRRDESDTTKADKIGGTGSQVLYLPMMEDLEPKYKSLRVVNRSIKGEPVRKKGKRTVKKMENAQVEFAG